MTLPKKIRKGDRLPGLPTDDWNQLSAGEAKRQRDRTEIPDSRKPKAKSPVVAQLAWLGDTLCEPGRAVKLVAPLVLPANDESAPFSGLAFLCDEFSEGDDAAPYAITMGSIEASETADGTLSTRDDDDTGTLTMDAGGHGIATGDVITILWEGGFRSGVVVGTVAGTAVPIDGGDGDVLPVTSTAVTVLKSASVGFGVLPEAYWAKLNVTDEAHEKANRPTTGTLLQSAESGAIPIIYKESGTGEKWAVVSLVFGIGDHFQIVRGTALDDVRPNVSTFRLSVQAPLEQYSANPGTTIRVANLPAALSANMGDDVWAIYNEGAGTIEESELDGTLTTRTDDDTAVITITDDPHGVLAGQMITVAWSPSGERTGMTVTAVNGQDISVDGGTGDNLPAETTALDLTVAAESVDWESMKTPFGHIPEFVVKITVAGSASGDPPSTGPGTVGGTVYQMLPDGLGGTSYEALDFAESLPVGAGINATPVIFNPFPYPPGPGLYPVEFRGAGPGTIMGETYVFFSLTGFDLQGHGNWVAGDDQVLTHPASGPPTWSDVSAIGDITFPPFDDSALWTAIDALPDSAGYCTELAGTTIHHDAITAAAGVQAVDIAAGEQQFWIHEAGATARTDAKWKTAGFYNAAHVCAALFNFAGTWEWAEFESYNATELQIFINDNDNFDLKTTATYNPAGKQLLVNDNDSWKWQSRDTALTPEGGDTGVTIKSVDSVEVTIDSGGTLKVKLNYTSYKVFGSSSGSGSTEGTGDIWNKNETNVVTDVACVSNSLVVTDETIEILTPP